MRHKLTTQIVEPQRRRDFWRSSLSEIYAPVEVKDCDIGGFHSEITSTQVGRLTVSRVDGAAQTISRPKAMIKSGHCDDYVAVVQLDGVLNHSVNGHQTVTMPGTITLYDLSRSYELRSQGHMNSIDVSISRADFHRALGPSSDIVGMNMGADCASAPMCVAFFRSMAEHGHLLDESNASRLATIGLDILTAGFAERLQIQPLRSLNAATHLYQAKDFIEANLDTCDLDVVMVAGALKISARRLHAIFAEHDLTVGAYIWERRLQKARKLLGDPACDALSIADIAYNAGFNDPSHFSRRFRLCFGTTAKEYRQEAREQCEQQRALNPTKL